MASGSFSVSTSNGYIGGHVDWSESNENIANNTTDVTATMYLSRTNTGYTSYGTDTFHVSINGADHANTISYSLTYNSNTQMVSGTTTVTHWTDGNATIPIGWSGGGGGSGVFTVTSGSGNATLLTIPRASTVSGTPSFTAGTQNLPISLNVASSSFHHSIQLWVQEINGSTWDWVGQRDNVGSSTTWVFTDGEIQQLYNTNNQYENRPILVRVYTYDSSNNQVGNYQDNSSGLMYAVPTGTTTLGSGGSFNIGTSISYSINNFSTALSGTGTFYYDITLTCTNVSPNFSVTWSNLTAQSGTLTLTAAQVNQLYAQTPNSNSVSCTVTTRTKYDTILTEDGNPTSHDATATANVANSNPMFGGSFTYADTNSTTTALTGNNQKIIQNQSIVQVTLNCAQMAMPQNGSTISSYVCSIGSTSMTMANNSPSIAPTLTIPANAGSTLPGNTTYYVIYTWILSGQETFMSPEASINIPNGAKDNLVVTIPAFPANVTAANIYIGTTSNMETKQGQITTSAGSYTQSTTLAAGTAMPNMVFNMGKLNVNSNTTIYVKAIDSRGNIATITNTMTVLPYSSPTTSTNFLRNNGFDSNTVLNLSGTFSNNITNNTILSVKYTYQQSSLVGTNGYPALTNYPSFSVATPPNYTTSPPTVSLDNTINWSVQVVVTDKLSTTTTTVSVGPGVPLLFIDTNMKSVGVGQFPSHNSSFEVTGDIFVNGTGSAPATTTLSNGANTLTVTQNTPVSIQSIKGRTLVNLLGSTGSFEVSLAPYNWTNWYLAGSATIAVDSSTCTTGNYSLKITSSASGFGEAYNGFQGLINPTSYYVIVGDAKNYNASGGVGVGFYNIGNASQAVTVSTTTATTWTPVFVRIQPSQLTGTTNFQVYGGYVNANASGQYGWVDGVRFYEITQAEYNAIGSMTAAQVAAKYPYVDNAQGIINPTIDYNGNRMVVQTTLHSNKDQSVYDELFIDTDGKLKKRQWFKEIYLNPNEAWQFGADYSGYKEINCTVNSSNNPDDYFGNPSYSILVRPDGYIMKKNSPASSAMNQYDFNTTTLNTIYIDIPDYYTGWGETYTPYQGEINTFMYGWKEYDGGTNGGDGKGTYSGSANRDWCRMNLYNGTYVDGQPFQPSFQAPTNSLFRLIYQLPSAQIVNIDPTGLILLPTGSNTVTLKQGIVVRERMKPVLYNGSMWVNTMSTVSGTKLWDSMFNYPCKNIIKIEKGNVDDTANWPIGAWSSGGNDVYGQQRATISQSLFDPTADYFVTYEIQYGGSMMADQMGISYPQSFRGLFDYTLSTLVDHENKLDNLDNLYAKRVNEPWITLPLFNGWVSYDQTGTSNWSKPGFYKDNMGIVRVKGLVANGTMNANCATLPAGYRPKDRLILTCVTGDNSVQRMDIEPNGNITPVAGNSGFISLDGLSFRAGVDW